MSSPEMRTVPSFKRMPSPGAVCPAMVSLFEVMRVLMPLASGICPDTANTIVRPAEGIVVSPSYSEPEPEELTFVTI